MVFMGSAELACPSLERLMGTAGLEVVGVVTQPDRPSGRRRQMAACPVAELARKRGATVLAPEQVNNPESLAALRAMKPDVIAVVAYGQILRRPLLELPALGCLNLHGSLLPRYRGAAPIQWAIANGETVTGVTVMFMNERMDAGDIVMMRDVPIGPDDTAGVLSATLALVGAELLVEGVLAVRDGRAERTPQDETRATFAPKLTKLDGRVDWTLPGTAIRNRIRAFNPWPGGWVILPDPHGDFLLRILRTRVEPVSGAVPGTVVALGNDGPLIAAGRDGVRLLEVQPEGKRPMNGGDFLRGHPLQVGAAVGQTAMHLP
jgi:methionyl-tRNA formyltransferase